MEKNIKSLIDDEIAVIKAKEDEKTDAPISNKEVINLPIESEVNALMTDSFSGNSAVGIINTTKEKILEKAEQKINQEKIIDKHSTKLSKVADDLMKVETEKAAIEVQKKDATNKAEKQEIKNRLIVLKSEAKRLRKTEKHKNKMQKITIKAERKQKHWEKLESTLKPLGYNYVPNPLALHILLMLVGIKAFINGIRTVGDAIFKCFKWVMFLCLVSIIVLIIPVTRTWILELLGFLT